MKDTGNIALSIIVGVLMFFLTYFFLQWSLPIAVVLSVGTYAGVSLISKPVYKLGGIDVDSLKNGTEIKTLMIEAQKDLVIIDKASKMGNNKDISHNANKLYQTGVHILEYLQKNPNKIGTARRFLNYYLNTSADIMEKYMGFLESKNRSPQLNKIYESTDRALVILNEAFEKQFVKLMENEIFDIESDIAVLEKTLEMEEVK